MAQQQHTYQSQGGREVLVEPVAPRYFEAVTQAGTTWRREVGTRGTEVLLRANAFKIFSVGKKSFDPPENACWYKHQVTILPTRTRAASALRPPLPPKQLLRRIWAALEATERSGETSLLGGVLGVYDGRSSCYTTKPYPEVVITTSVTLGPRGTFSLSITNSIVIPVIELKKWWLAQPAEQSHVLDALQALNTLWVHGFSSAFLSPANRSTTYIGGPEAQAMGLGREHFPFDVGGEIELWRGLFQAVKLTPQGPSLNVDTSSGAFVQSGDLINVLSSFLGLRRKNDLAVSALRGHDSTKATRFIKNLHIDIFPPNHVAHKHAVKVRGGILKTSARETRFVIQNGDHEEEMSVEDYFLKQYNIRLTYPDFPCVAIKTGVYYPLEVCSVAVGNKYRVKLNAAQQALASGFQVLKPLQRFGFVDKMLSWNQSPKGEPIGPAIGPLAGHVQPYLFEFGIEIGGQVKLKGRTLSPPDIAFQRSVVNVKRGAWQMSRRDKFSLPMGFKSYAIILTSSGDGRNAGAWFPPFMDACRGFGMTLDASSDNRNATVFMPDKTSPLVDCEAAFDEAIERAHQVFGSPPQVIFCIFKAQNDDRYNIFKSLGVRRGIATQAMQSKLLNKASDFQAFINVGMKVNAKLGGVNFLHAPGTTNGDAPARRAAGYLESHPAMVFDARARKDEIIGNLFNIVVKLLRRRVEFNQGRAPPDRLFFFRDGVSDGEFSAILTREVPAIRRALEVVAKDFPGWHPRLTYITCAKGHHVRFMPKDVHNSEKTRRGDVPPVIGNAPAGTVVDTQIVDPRNVEWFGSAHAADLGTTRMVKFNVMVDDNNVSLDDLQSIANAQGHAFQRCNLAISGPAYVRYADIVCAKVKGWMSTIDSEDGGSSVGGESMDGTKESRAADLLRYQAVVDGMASGLEMMRSSGRAWWI